MAINIIKASAGSGKTTRLVAGLFNHLDDKRILATTFTKLGAREIQERVLQKLTDERLIKDIIDQKRVVITTLDSFFYQLLRRAKEYVIIDTNYKHVMQSVQLYVDSHFDDVEVLLPHFLHSKRLSGLLGFLAEYFQEIKACYTGSWFLPEYDRCERVNAPTLDAIYRELRSSLSKLPTASLVAAIEKLLLLYNQEDYLELLKTTLAQTLYLDAEPKYRTKLPQVLADMLRPMLGYAVFKVKEAERFATLSRLEIFHQLDRLYSRLKGLDITFDEIYQLLRIEYPELSRSFDVIYVDEFQDTSEEQLLALKRLLESNPASEVFIVGDVKQAIYGFRTKGFKPFAKISGEIEYSVANYRSGPEILRFVDDFFNFLSSRFPECSWFNEYRAHEVQNLVPSFVEYRSFVDEADYLEAVALELIKAKYTETAILARSNKILDGLYDLLRFELKVSRAGGKRLLECELAVLVMSILKGIEEPAARRTVYQLVSFSQLGIQSYLDEIWATSYMCSGDNKAYHQRLYPLLLALADYPEIEIIYQVLRDNAYQPLSVVLAAFEQQRVASEESDLNLLTIHQAKGLQFKRVILIEPPTMKEGRSRGISVVDGRMIFTPKGGKKIMRYYPEYPDNEFSYDEELSLYYVALTRAKEELWIWEKEEESVMADFFSYGSRGCKSFTR